DRTVTGVQTCALPIFRCPAAWPWNVEDARGVEGQSREYHNCSGKHAGMLVASARRGDPIETYADASHPLQRAVLDAVLRLSGMRSEERRVGKEGRARW